MFSRGTPGFDAIVGNPPFMGGMKISGSLSSEYLGWLCDCCPEAGDRTDLVAYFFRRSFSLLRGGGALGLVATNTIAQGDTRRGGLTWIARNGGDIFFGTRRLRWPGPAAVIVSVVHIFKGKYPAQHFLDGNPVPAITSYLFHGGTSEEVRRIESNEGKAFIGCNILGMGFTFDDSNPAAATPVAEMKKLVDRDARNAELIHPFIGGLEMNTSPTQQPTRWVIDFEDEPKERLLSGRTCLRSSRTEYGLSARGCPLNISVDGGSSAVATSAGAKRSSLFSVCWPFRRWPSIARSSFCR